MLVLPPRRVGVVYHDGEEPVPGRVVAKSNGSQFCSVGYASICFQSSSTWMDGLEGVNMTI